MIEVKFLTRFLDITGEKVTQIEEAKDMNTLIDILNEKYQNGFKDVLLDDNGNIRDYLKVIVNGKDVRSINGLETPLNDGDQVVMFQTIAGGWSGSLNMNPYFFLEIFFVKLKLRP